MKEKPESKPTKYTLEDMHAAVLKVEEIAKYLRRYGTCDEAFIATIAEDDARGILIEMATLEGMRD